MSSADNPKPSPSGTITILPFSGEPYPSRVKQYYQDLVHFHGTDNVLVIKRYPAATEALQDAFSRVTDSIEQPRVQTLTGHAIKLLGGVDDPPTVLYDNERRILIQQFLEEYGTAGSERGSWETDYLEKASANDSFAADFGRFVVEATWQDQEIETSNDDLEALAAAQEEFLAYLNERGYIDISQTLVRARDELIRRDDVAELAGEYDAVLALEFEEFAPIGREYLAAMTEDVKLHCIAEQHAAVQRPWTEPGGIESLVESGGAGDFTLDQSSQSAGRRRDVTPQQGIAEFFARGVTETTGVSVDVHKIHKTTFQEHIRAIGEQIEFLRTQRGWDYTDFGVILRDSVSPVEDTITELQAMGIPTASVAGYPLEHDPTARELFIVVDLLAEHGPVAEKFQTEQLLTRCEILGTDDYEESTSAQETVTQAIEAVAGASTVHEGLWRWILETDLKWRVAATEPPLDARLQFKHAADIIDLAQFVSEQPESTAAWALLRRALEDMFESSGSNWAVTDIEPGEDGVLVDPARAFKHQSCKAAFLVSVVDEEYPTGPEFNRLFSPATMKRLDGYPTVTNPSPSDVLDTFPRDALTAFTTEAVDQSEDPSFRRPTESYYGALYARMLAIGCRAGTNKVYFCTYEKDGTGTSSRHQQSRFLNALEDEVGEIAAIDSNTIRTSGEAVTHALTSVDRSLDTLRKSLSDPEMVDLDELEAEFGGVQTLLEKDPPEELTEAIQAQVDFAQGRVRNE